MKMARRDRRTVAGRGLVLAAAALVAATLIWAARPAMPTASATAETDIVRGCAWVAWILAGYVTLAVAAAALEQVAAAGGLAAAWLSRCSPPRLRQLVHLAVTASLAATVVGAGAAAPAMAAAGHHVTTTRGPRPNAGSGALDWPGLTDPAPIATPTLPPRPSTSAAPIATHHRPTTSSRPTPAPTHRVTATHEPTATGGGRPGRHHRAQLGLVGGPRTAARLPPLPAGDIVVQAGDTLWSIATRALAPGSSATDITAEWHHWYAANRDVIGADPGLIYPGQRLRPPAATPDHAHHATGTRSTR
jgi:resuscitation-promoting factor RpfA